MHDKKKTERGFDRTWVMKKRDILRDLLLSPTRQSTFAAERVRAGTETSQTRTKTGEASLLLLRLLQVESRETDGTVVRTTLRLRRRAVGVAVSGVHWHTVGDVDALVRIVAVLRLVGNVKAAGTG